MNKLDVATFFKRAQQAVSKHSPEILTGVGIAGMITTTVLAVRATPKALKLIDERKEAAHKSKLTVKETVKATWKCYLPATITGAASVTCLVGSASISNRRNAALFTAYKLSETALAEYREKVIETVGENKEKSIRGKVNQDRIEKNPPGANEIVLTGHGNTLFYDHMSGRYFHSDIHIVKRAINELNRKLVTSPFSYVSLNDFYEELNLEPTSLGHEVGWNINDGSIELDLDARLTEKGEACVVLDITVPPKYNFANVY